MACVGELLPPEDFGVALEEEPEETVELPPPDDVTAELPLFAVEPPPPPHATATRVRLAREAAITRCRISPLSSVRHKVGTSPGRRRATDLKRPGYGPLGQG